MEREDLWVRPFGAVLREGNSGTTTANVVVYLEGANGDPANGRLDHFDNIHNHSISVRP